MSDTKDTCCGTTNTSKTFYWLLAGTPRRPWRPS